MNKSPNWSVIYDDKLEKIEQLYIENQILRQPDTSVMIPNSKKSESYEDFLIRIKQKFLNNLTNGYYYSAFRNLQKRIPILAEYLIVECYDENYLDIDTFSEIFRDIYIYAKKDRTLFSNEVDNNKLIEIFKYCNPIKLMNEDEANYLNNVTSPLTIYRGVTGRTFNDAVKGISWTTNIEKAKEFAIKNMEIYNLNNALVIAGEINSQDIIAYFNDSGRYENEVIVTPLTIFKTKIIKQLK